MSLNEPHPDLDELLGSIGEAGMRLSNIAASEGAAGNISLAIGCPSKCAAASRSLRNLSCRSRRWRWQEN